MLNWIRSLDRVLKGEATKPEALRGGTIDLPVGGLTVVLIVLGAVYGACMGAFALVTLVGRHAARGLPADGRTARPRCRCCFS